MRLNRSPSSGSCVAKVARERMPQYGIRVLDKSRTIDATYNVMRGANGIIYSRVSHSVSFASLSRQSGSWYYAQAPIQADCVP